MREEVSATDGVRSPLPVIGAASQADSGSLNFGSTSSISLPGQRQLQVIRPNKYDDVENVTKVLKVGDVAILSLVNTPGDLSKRILDFSFGAASALDATVDCIADKTFSIARGVPLTDTEKMDLSSMGVI